MATNSGVSGDLKLLGVFLSPSWLSGLVAVVAGVSVIGGSIALTHLGGAAQQSLLGLHLAYRQSSVGASVQTIGNSFAGNTQINNVLLFLFWGMVGLVVYSIAQSAVSEFKNADELLHELASARAKRLGIMENVASRTLIRLGALVAWWLLSRFMVYKLVPYAIASAHLSALHLTSAADWWRTLLAGLACILGVHLLAVLLRLVTLRARLFDSEIVE